MSTTKLARSLGVLLLAGLLVLATYGYQFGRGNHSVYLLAALRSVDPALLKRDWFTVDTLQYHVAFTALTSVLMRLHCVAAGFCALYLALIGLFILSWRWIVLHLGGDDRCFIISVALYFISAAGTGLGMYQFFQDSALLPSNIANVLLLTGIAMWLGKRLEMSGACFGAAGLFHLNHALIGGLLWIILCWRAGRWQVLPSIAALLPGATNILLALHAKLHNSGGMPLAEFIKLYVRLRHPHHYDPSTWPIALWCAFVWTALAALWLLPRGAVRQATIFFCILTALALLGAGVFYASETLVQLSLYRFSIYVELFGCAAAAIWIGRIRHCASAAVVVCAALIAAGAVRGPFFGLFKMPKDDADYVALCAWVLRNTPVDALFIVPPEEESMRFHGQRAIVVDYKAVPQLSAELAQWQQRLCAELALPSLDQVPHGYVQTMAALRARFDELPSDHFVSLARQYDADYLVSGRALPELEPQRIRAAPLSHYVLYDLRSFRAPELMRSAE